MSKKNSRTGRTNKQSCLQSKHNMNNDHPYIIDIFCNYLHATRQGKIVNFLGIPSHIGIHGNSKADSAAKSALQFQIVKFTDLNLFEQTTQLQS